MNTFDLPLDRVKEDDVRLPDSDEAYETAMGESLRDHQDYPVIARPDVEPGWFIMVDGHTRRRAALRVGLKTLKAVLVDKPLTEAEIRLIQLRTDIFKKKLTAYELSMLLIGLEKDNPGPVKQLAAKVHMEESLVWKYLQAKKLRAADLEAYRTGEIGLKEMVKRAKAPKPQEEEQPEEKTTGASLKLALSGGRVVIFKGEQITYDAVLAWADDLIKEVKAAKKEGIRIATFARAMADKAKKAKAESKAAAQ